MLSNNWTLSVSFWEGFANKNSTQAAAELCQGQHLLK